MCYFLNFPMILSSMALLLPFYFSSLMSFMLHKSFISKKKTTFFPFTDGGFLFF